MKFATKEDIECPIAHVFAQATDFNGFERQAMRRGADVRRRDSLGHFGLGSAWEVMFKFRSKDRNLTAEVTAWEPMNGYVVATSVSGIDATLLVELVPLSRNRTRLTVTIDLAPKTLGARLMVQSMKLGRGTLQRRFDLRVADYASDITERYQKV